MKVNNQNRQFIGLVVSDKMTNSVTVRVIKKESHPLYKKVVKKYIRYTAHNELEDVKTGDTVKILETKPVSKNKRWIVVEKMKA
jgi:small subunit ribosomal protein S17